MRCFGRPIVEGCTGPYTELACAACIAKEGVCLANRPVATCSGPANQATACRFCKTTDMRGCNLVDLATSRPATVAWMSGLALNNVPPIKRVYTKHDNLTPAQIDQKLNRSQVNFCPWVQIGKLYTTVTTGNDQGWTELIRTVLYPQGDRTFAVFTGRHGVEHGTITKDYEDLFSDRIPDANHLLEDILKKVEVDSHYRASADKPKIRLYNVGTTAGTTMTKTQRLALERLKAGDTVIFAWCFSFLSFYKVNTAGATAKLYDMNLGYNKSIPDIVAQHYGWAEVMHLKRQNVANRRKYAAWKTKVDRKRTDAKTLIKDARRPDSTVDTDKLFADLASHVHQL